MSAGRSIPLDRGFLIPCRRSGQGWCGALASRHLSGTGIPKTAEGRGGLSIAAFKSPLRPIFPQDPLEAGLAALPGLGVSGPAGTACGVYIARSSERMSTVTMKPVVPLYSKALSPRFQDSISVGIILKPSLRGTAK